MFFFLFSFFVFHDAEKGKNNSRKVPFVKMSISFCENSIFGHQWTVGEGRGGGVRHGPAFMFFISLFSTFLKMFLFSSFFLIFLPNIFHCQHWYQSLTVDVPVVSGAPSNCGVLTTQGGKVGFGLGHQPGREHASTPQREAPRLLKRSLPRMDYCCFCCCCGCGGAHAVLMSCVFQNATLGCTHLRWQSTWESDSLCPRHLGLDVRMDGGLKMPRNTASPSQTHTKPNSP